MGNETVEVFVAAYGTEKGAADALKDFKTAQLEGAILIVDGAVVVHTADGKVKYDETADPNTRRWTKRGAIAGGVNVILQPHITIAYSQGGMMAPDGRCKFGDAKGDGYVRSEGAGVVLLELLDEHLPDWQPNPGKGGLSLWVRLPAPMSSALSAAASRTTAEPASGRRVRFA